MPRYFFHVIDGVETIDNEGTVLANLDEARAQRSCCRAPC